MIKNIVFDIGKVLAYFEPEKYVDSLEYDKDTREKILSAVFYNPLWAEFDRGAMSTEEFEEAFVANAPEYEEQIRETFRNMGGTTEIMPYTMEWIKDLKSRGYQLYVISNYAEYMFEQTKHKLEFLSYLDGAVFSYQQKVIKPNRKIFETLLNQYHLKAEECVFIDDRPENVEGAKALGFYGIPFQNFEQASAKLNKLLL